MKCRIARGAARRPFGAEIRSNLVRAGGGDVIERKNFIFHKKNVVETMLRRAIPVRPGGRPADITCMLEAFPLCHKCPLLLILRKCFHCAGRASGATWKQGPAAFRTEARRPPGRVA
jgi:hypothetical protein